MRTSNPALRASTFAPARAGVEPMTVNGTIHKTGLLLLLVILSGGFVWNTFFTQGPEAVKGWMIGGAIGGFVVAMITVFKASAAPITAPIYALLEGLFLGGASASLERYLPGIVLQAAGLTLLTLFSLLLAYRAGLVRATEKFKLGVFAATGGIALVYVASMVSGLFGVGLPFIHDGGIVGIGFSLFVVAIAALNLVLDFDLIEQGVARGAPRVMEWYGAFVLMVTLVWLYLEMLRLLAKLRSSD